MSILQAMIKYARSMPARFHTPGHKGKPSGSALDEILALDITELPFSDDYFNPTGIIRESMDKARSFYGSAETFLLVNGSTIGLHAAIHAVVNTARANNQQQHSPSPAALVDCASTSLSNPTEPPCSCRDTNNPAEPPCSCRDTNNPAELSPLHLDYHRAVAQKNDNAYQLSPRVVVAGECHRAVMSGITLANASAVHCAISPQSISEALAASGACAVVATSPDYCGRCVDLEAIGEECRAHGAVLIADSSHGAHFAASKLFPKNSGADISVCSAHKTMHALTQGSFLNVYNAELVNSVRRSLHLFASTSPSYLIMASLEHALDYAKANEHRYIALHKLVNEMRAQLPLEPTDDFTRLVVNCGSLGGAAVYQRLCEQGIYAEKHDDSRVIFILTAADDESSIRPLIDALNIILKM